MESKPKRGAGRAREIATERLLLVPATAALARAELRDPKRFAILLGARVPPEWPPPLNDEGSMRWMLDLLEKHGDGVGWGTWYLVRKADRAAIGNIGFKGAPSTAGDGGDGDCTVEIGYSVLEAEQRRGYAPEAVAALVAWAFEHPEIDAVLAHTLPELIPSIRVLEKCGFAFDGEAEEDGMKVVQYRRDRPT